MKIALIGKSAFGADVYQELINAGHEIVVVCTEPDINGRPDLLTLAARKNNTPIMKAVRWGQKNSKTKKFEVISDLFEEYKKFNAEINVLPFCTQFIPQEMLEYPKHKTIIYHPSLLPKHRGASAINWTLINGDTEAGFTIFWADEGVDTGPILLQKKCSVLENDTVISLYTRFLYPEGVKGTVEAVNLIAANKAPKVVQTEEGASYEPYIIKKPELAKIDWNVSQLVLHNFIRGNDNIPGAWSFLNNEKVTFLGSSLWRRFDVPGNARKIEIKELPEGFMWAHDKGVLIKTSDKKYVNVENLKLSDGRMIKASNFGLDQIEEDKLDLNDNELEKISMLKQTWKNIIGIEIDNKTNFFDTGASSADVTRLLYETKLIFEIELKTTEVYLAPTFDEFVNVVIKRVRGQTLTEINFNKFEDIVSGTKIVVPTQMFINGQFCDSESKRKINTINPANEKVICQIPRSTAKDVDWAVRCAHEAFNYGEWSKISPRDRGKLLYKIADLMEQHKEELAIIESIDSGAVYTLALKTHVGMSIDVWRYFAGWCDKIEGKTIPITEARPNFNLCFTIREPVGVVGLIIPWNYPLMMLSWKMAACLAAGNTVVLKPAEVTPLTALKFAELTTKVGIPAGVINIVTGSGKEAGQAIVNHPLVRKIGFTGSTLIGAQLMESCAKSNLKKISLELGGKSPLIIFKDVDLNKIVKQACDAVFFNKGENCIAAGRLFVEESIYDNFIERAVDLVSKIVVGDPLDYKTDQGPQNHLKHILSLEKFIEKAVADGAKIAFGGKRLKREGFYFSPTILTDVSDNNFAAIEESFGPIMIISKFSENNIDELIEKANCSEYGLAAGIFSKNLNLSLRVAKKIKAGTVFLNTYQKTDVAAPFGGFKQSGFGKDLGEEALNEYLQTKTITIEY